MACFGVIEQHDHTRYTIQITSGDFGKLAELRVHFFAISARLMRRVLIDHARANGFQKRGAGQFLNMLNEEKIATPAHRAELVALDDALSRLQ